MKNLRKNFIMVLLLCLWGVSSPSQTTTDSIPAKKKFDNYYCPFHSKIKTPFREKVSTFGEYLSLGVGFAYEYGIPGGGLHYSYSVAYKSHLLTLTGVSTDGSIGYKDNKTNYFAIMLGESLRMEHLIMSASTGIARSNIYITSNANFYYYNIFYRTGLITVPLEFKMFALLHDAFGGGMVISRDIVSPRVFSNYYVGLSIVYGYWNRPYKTH